jgi:hypothetical protein
LCGRFATNVGIVPFSRFLGKKELTY